MTRYAHLLSNVYFSQVEKRNKAAYQQQLLAYTKLYVKLEQLSLKPTWDQAIYFFGKELMMPSDLQPINHNWWFISLHLNQYA